LNILYFNSLIFTVAYFVCWCYTTFSLVLCFWWKGWHLSDRWNWILLVNFANFRHFINILPRISSLLSLFLFFCISIFLTVTIIIFIFWDWSYYLPRFTLSHLRKQQIFAVIIRNLVVAVRIIWSKMPRKSHTSCLTHKSYC
jgi:hypothetical protein